MSDFLSSFLTFTSSTFAFMTVEITEWAIFVHDEAGWHIRFKRAKRYPTLRPTISTLKVTGILFAILLIYAPFIVPGVFLNPYVVYLVSLTKFWGLLFLVSIAFSFLWIWHHIVGKKWNWQQYLLAAASIALFLAYVVANLLT
jgi:hypothetical protein